MNIQMDKEYTTVDGRPVVIYNIMDDKGFPVHGAWQGSGGEWYVQQWTLQGTALTTCKKVHLIEKPKPKIKEVFYINVYGKGMQGLTWSSRMEADWSAGHARTACIRVEIEYEEGQFDE